MSAHLPDIAHPRSRMGNPDALGVRGVSRASSHRGNVLSRASAAPLSPPNGQTAYRSPRKHTSSSTGSRSVMGAGEEFGGGSRGFSNAPLETIPDGVEVINGDPTKTRLPVFGLYDSMA